MKRSAVVWGVLLILVQLPAIVGAAILTAHVEPFSVVGGSGEKNLPLTLQTLLISRLSGEKVLVLDSAKGALVLVNGAYIQFGKFFSIDVTARDPAGGALARAYEQGEGEDAMLPTMTKVAEKLIGLLVVAQQTKPSVPEAAALHGTVIPSPKVTMLPQDSPDVIRAESPGKSSSAGSVGKWLPGAYIGLAQLRTLTSGEHELYLLQKHSLQVVRHGARTEQLAEAEFASDENPLTVDTADLDGDGLPEAYVTVMRSGELASQVWTFKDNRLTRIADNLPYYFRVLSLPGGARQLYVQQMGRGDEFYGPVFELKRGSKGYETQNQLKLPKFAHIFNFNRFTDTDGKGRIVALHPDGFILVYDTNSGEELWRSNEKYGGSELYLSINNVQNARFPGDNLRKVFLEQRITVTRNGEIIVPQNSGTWVVGDSRSYSQNTVYAFEWNGVALDERWHTKVSQNYLADYCLDEERKELLMIEVVTKAGMINKGASAIMIKKVGSSQ